MTFDETLQHFQVKKRYGDKVQCTCPAHDDKQASLTITKGNKCTLLHCHAGCQLDDILTAAGLKKSDLFYEERQQSGDWRGYVEKREGRKVEGVYNYVSLNGSYAFTKLRLQGKKIIYGRMESERFLYGLNGRSRKEYKAVFLPDGLEGLKKAISENVPICVPEGEKDALTLKSKGYTVVTYGGVNDWQSDFSVLFKGADVVVLADNDLPGKSVAEQIKSDLAGIAKSVKVIVPTPDIQKGDISDYFAQGHSKEDFEKLICTLPEKSVSVEVRNEVDLLQFHHLSPNGKITGVFHNAIFEYIKQKYDLFVCGSTPYIYSGGYYQADTSGAKLKSIIRGLIFPEFIKAATVNNIYALFLQDITLEKQFDELNNYPPHWICFTNGMYDCKKKILLPHSPKYLCINQVPHDYIPGSHHEGKKIEEFLKFICDSADDREMLLQYVGYSLTRDVGQQKFLVLCGEGGSGKSTVIRLIETLVGSRNVSNISLTDLQQRFASFGLMSKLVNSCADLEVDMLSDTTVIKKILGEDTLRAEQKGKDAVSFKSYAKLVFSTNELPLIKSEKTNGFYRRLLVLTMNKVPLQKNPHLFEELSQEIDYFLEIAVQAVGRMYENEIIVTSQNSEKAVLQLRRDSDTVQAFLSECCVDDKCGKVERVTLYRKYDNYCEETDRQAMTKNNFYRALRTKGYEEIKTHGNRYFWGISFQKTAPETAPETSKTAPIDDFIDVTEENPFT